ncbi:MAG: nuclear transport factor 2 family protein [Rudaea sp.]|uniref:nuclear transport factor 2 family protein n=1 Tax=Rudaea sp. TaxID=2136325 RepID=UPI0039E5FF4C
MQQQALARHQQKPFESVNGAFMLLHGSPQAKRRRKTAISQGLSPCLRANSSRPAIGRFIMSKETIMSATVRCIASSLVVAIGLACASGRAQASTETEIRAAFDRFVQVQNAHDATALSGLLSDSPQFLWITRGTAIWGREAALQRFAGLYQGTWQLEPDLASVRVVDLSKDAARLYAEVKFTIGAPNQPAQTTRFLFNQEWVKSHGTWRVMSILPIPAAAP